VVERPAWKGPELKQLCVEVFAVKGKVLFLSSVQASCDKCRLRAVCVRGKPGGFSRRLYFVV
jgi:uncharacterized protein (UPF0179 family)